MSVEGIPAMIISDSWRFTTASISLNRVARLDSHSQRFAFQAICTFFAYPCQVVWMIHVTSSSFSIHLWISHGMLPTHQMVMPNTCNNWLEVNLTKMGCGSSGFLVLKKRLNPILFRPFAGLSSCLLVISSLNGPCITQDMGIHLMMVLMTRSTFTNEGPSNLPFFHTRSCFNLRCWLCKDFESYEAEHMLTWHIHLEPLFTQSISFQATLGAIGSLMFSTGSLISS
jgi:hypothetical protein